MSAGRMRLFMLCALAVCSVRAQYFPFVGGRQPQMPEISGSVRLEPAEAVVGTPCHFVFSFKGGGQVKVEKVFGLPEHGDGVEYLAEVLEPYADNTYRLPVRFLGPCTNTFEIAVVGMQTVVRGAGTPFHSSFSTSFQKRLPPCRVNVRPLPQEGRPAAFCGAVGTKFRMTQTLSPASVHPGDLVTATYELVYDGYCPSNAWPSIEHLPRDFKAYEPKLAARGANSFKWTQILVPRTASATNSALVSLCYYNPRTCRYEFARAFPERLAFVSDKAASTENTAVLVAAPEGAGPAETAGGRAGAAPLVLRFAPSDESPVVATLPPDTPATELARSGGWRRVETPRAIGWCR